MCSSDLIIDENNTYAFNPSVQTFNQPVSDTPDTTLSKLMAEGTGMTLADAKSALAELTGYDVYFVVKAITPNGNNSNGLSQQCYRNVIKVTPDP